MASSITVQDLLEPVFYCRGCHSLDIRVREEMASEDWDGSYCADCQSTDIAECTIGEWLEEDERRKKAKRDREWRR